MKKYVNPSMLLIEINADIDTILELSPDGDGMDVELGDLLKP